MHGQHVLLIGHHVRLTLEMTERDVLTQMANWNNFHCTNADRMKGL